jgi:AraC family transcriptional regulator
VQTGKCQKDECPSIPSTRRSGSSKVILPARSTARFENGNVLLIAGIVQRYTCETSAGIPSQWQRFLPQIGSIPGQVGPTAFGVRWNGDEDGNFNYLCGVQVSDFSRLPTEFGHVRVPAQRYAVFSHHEHVSTIRSTWATIWNKWLSESGHEPVDAPDCERYGPGFDPRTGTGGLEIWVPIKMPLATEGCS